MYYNELSACMEKLSQRGKGILAADESEGTIGKRFAAIDLENTEENRRRYRNLLADTEGLEQYIQGVILFEETFTQKDDQGISLPELFQHKGIVPGIKVDKGLVDMANTEGEKITQGLDGLEERLIHFKKLGAQFAKWRNVYSITEFTPSLKMIKAGAEILARYASICQAVGIVPIVEPEILMDGEHDIESAAEVSAIVLHELFHTFFLYHIDLEHIILKPSMITCGKACKPFSSPLEIADYTLKVFRDEVPASVPSINFLSGGQTPDQATENLNAINSQGHQPWILSFSYGRALQEECLQVWRGKDENIAAAQEALLERARLNSLAVKV